MWVTFAYRTRGRIFKSRYYGILWIENDEDTTQSPIRDWLPSTHASSCPLLSFSLWPSAPINPYYKPTSVCLTWYIIRLFKYSLCHVSRIIFPSSETHSFPKIILPLFFMTLCLHKRNRYLSIKNSHLFQLSRCPLAVSSYTEQSY